MKTKQKKSYKDGLKRCVICDEYMDVINFHRNRAMRDGLSHYCKSCNVIKFHEYYQANKERCRSINYKSMVLHRNRQNARSLANCTYPEAQVCGADGCFELGHRHHPDYNKPKEIVWLCRKHHCLLHSELLM